MRIPADDKRSFLPVAMGLAIMIGLWFTSIWIRYDVPQNHQQFDLRDRLNPYNMEYRQDEWPLKDPLFVSVTIATNLIVFGLSAFVAAFFSRATWRVTVWPMLSGAGLLFFVFGGWMQLIALAMLTGLGQRFAWLFDFSTAAGFIILGSRVGAQLGHREIAPQQGSV